MPVIAPARGRLSPRGPMTDEDDDANETMTEEQALAFLASLRTKLPSARLKESKAEELAEELWDAQYPRGT